MNADDLVRDETYQLNDGSKVKYLGTYVYHDRFLTTKYEFETETGSVIQLHRSRVHAYIRKVNK